MAGMIFSFCQLHIPGIHSLFVKKKKQKKKKQKERKKNCSRFVMLYISLCSSAGDVIYNINIAGFFFLSR